MHFPFLTRRKNLIRHIASMNSNSFRNVAIPLKIHKNVCLFSPLLRKSVSTPTDQSPGAPTLRTTFLSESCSSTDSLPPWAWSFNLDMRKLGANLIQFRLGDDQIYDIKWYFSINFPYKSYRINW